MVAASAKKLYAGERLAPVKKVTEDQASWLLTVGEGFGKQQYRFVQSYAKKNQKKVCAGK